MTRLALLLAVLIGGCDGYRSDMPDEFELTLTGSQEATITGAHGYTWLSRYTGIGTSNSYGIALRTAPTSAMASPFYEVTVPDSVAKVTLFFSGAAVPEGEYNIEGVPWAGGSLRIDGRWYVAHAGSVTVARDGERLTGSFRFTDLYWLAEAPDGGPSGLRVDGRFDIGRDE